MKISVLYLLNKALIGPQLVLFSLLIFILQKNLGASLFQLTIMTSIRPLSSLFAFWAGAFISSKPHHVRPFLIFTSLAGSIPCLFFPFIENVWLFIGGYTLFLIASKASTPPWIEQMKKRGNKESLSSVFAFGNSIYYIANIVFPVCFSFFMDQYEHIWTYLFAAVSFVQLSSITLVFFLEDEEKLPGKKTFWDAPIKGWELLKNSPGFSHYLALFFLGSAGLMMIQPTLPIFFEKQLNLSYTELALAFSLCKGIAFIVSAPFWAKYANTATLYTINTLVQLLGCVYIAFLLAADGQIAWLYLAYLFYGVLQGGSEQSWVLSGPTFAGNEDSSLYSSMNLVISGLRGGVLPFVGVALYKLLGAQALFALALLPGIAGAFYGSWLDRKYTLAPAK